MLMPDSLFRDVLLKLAEDTGSTRIIQQVEGGLLVALLNQYRYWTPSRARLLGAELVREFSTFLRTETWGWKCSRRAMAWGTCLIRRCLCMFHLYSEAAICAAWELVIRHGRTEFDLDTANEDAITLELHERLYDDIFNKGIVDGFDREVFTSVHREPKVRNFNRRHPDKMPDTWWISSTALPE